MHTSPAYAEDVYIGANSGIDFQGHRATFVGRRERARRNRDLPPAIRARPESVRLAAQQPIRRTGRADVAGRVLIPWERVFLTEPSPSRWPAGCSGTSFTAGWQRPSSRWGWRLACTHAMGLAAHDATVEYLIDLITDVQTVRNCLRATELDPNSRRKAFAPPTMPILSAGSIAMLKARPRMEEILRILPGSSLIVAPSDRDLRDPALPAGPGGLVRRRRLYCDAARGAAADGVGSCRFRA